MMKRMFGLLVCAEQMAVAAEAAAVASGRSLVSLVVVFMGKMRGLGRAGEIRELKAGEEGRLLALHQQKYRAVYRLKGRWGRLFFGVPLNPK